MAYPDPDGAGVPGCRFNPYETHWPPARNADPGHWRSKLKWVESMNSVVSLDSIDMERLLFTIDTSIKVNKRFQFFLWSQGALQSFLPHETMICLFGDLHGMRVRHEIFSRGLVAPEFEALVGDPIKGFLPELIAAWHENASKPLVYTRDRLPHPSLAHWYEGHMLCHGARDAGGAFGSLFIFLRTPSPASMHEVYLAELLMPHLHMALQRMCQNETDVTGSLRSRDPGAELGARWQDQSRDRPDPVDQPADREEPRPEDPAQAQRLQPGSGRRQGGGQRPVRQPSRRPAQSVVPSPRGLWRAPGPAVHPPE